MVFEDANARIRFDDAGHATGLSAGRQTIGGGFELSKDAMTSTGAFQDGAPMHQVKRLDGVEQLSPA